MRSRMNLIGAAVCGGLIAGTLLIVICQADEPIATAPVEAGAVTEIWEYAEKHLWKKYNDGTPNEGVFIQAVRYTKNSKPKYLVRIFYQLRLDGDFEISIPSDRVPDVIDFVKRATDVKQLASPDISYARAVFQPVQGTEFWVRRHILSGQWDINVSGYVVDIEIDDMVKSLRAALKDVEKMERTGAINL